MRRAMLTNRPLGGAAGPGIASMGALSPQANSTEFELGWAFTVGGVGISVPKLRIYPYYTGTITANLWSSGGTKLGSVAIAGVADTWSEGTLSAPLSLSASTTYVVSLTKPSGAAGHHATPLADIVTNAAISKVEGRYNATSGSFPNTASATFLYGLADIVIG